MCSGQGGLIIGLAAGGTPTMQAGRVIGSAAFSLVGEATAAVTQAITGRGGARYQQSGNQYRLSPAPQDAGEQARHSDTNSQDSTVQLLLEQLVDLLRVGLALR